MIIIILKRQIIAVRKKITLIKFIVSYFFTGRPGVLNRSVSLCQKPFAEVNSWRFGALESEWYLPWNSRTMLITLAGVFCLNVLITSSFYS